MTTDPRLSKMGLSTLRAVAVEVDAEEEFRLRKAEEMGAPFLPRIRRDTFIRFLCLVCGLDFSVRADTAILHRHRCPSKICEGRKA